MAETLGTLISALRDQLDESMGPRQWTDAMLRRWLYEGAQDIARRTLLLQKTFDLVLIANIYQYTVPTTAGLLEIAACYWLPGGADTRVVPMEGRPYGSMDAIRGSYPASGASTPQVFTAWGYQPTLNIEVWPAPYINSTLRIFGSFLPTPITNFATTASDATNLDVPDGYTDVVLDYAEVKARRKDRDPSWQESAQIYEQKIGNMQDAYNVLSAPREFQYSSPAGPLPTWLTDMR